MKHGNVRFMLPFIIALSLLAAFIITTPVFAQDELPPEAPVPTEIIPVVEENPIVEPAPLETAPPEEVVQVEEVPVEEELPPVVEEAASEEVIPAIEDELVPALEEITEVMVDAGLELVDENGEPLSLASEEAFELVANSDPYYKAGSIYIGWSAGGTCPAIVLPANCHTGSLNPLTDAVNNFSIDGGFGAIYVEAGAYSGVIVINAIPNLSGLIGATDPATKEPLANLNGRIWVENMNAGFTISGFDIDYSTSLAGIYLINNVGTVKIEDVEITNTSTSGHGIEIQNHNGAVIINRAKVNGNAGGGVLINNTTGSAGVTVTNSSFDYNGSDTIDHVAGLTIATKGAVSFDGITASHNSGAEPGVFLRQSGAVTIKSSVFNENAGFGVTNDYSYAITPGFVPTGNITFQNVYASYNAMGGMDLYTKGNISLTAVHADVNGAQGASLNTCRNVGGVCTWLGTGVVTIKDSTFQDNAPITFSLNVLSRGAITLTNVLANLNNDLAVTPKEPSGAYLDNGYSQVIVPISITNSDFSGNESDGVKIYSRGAVTLNKVTANNNYDGYGVYIDNCLLSGGLCTGKGAVTITGTAAGDNQFISNRSNNLDIQSKGAISIKYTYANDSIVGSGADLNNTFTGATTGVTISDSKFGDYSSGNTGSGLIINTNGSVALTRVDAIDSTSGDGSRIFLHGTSGTVTIKDGYFSYNDLAGLNIDGKGNVTITDVSCYYNTIGADINNTSGTGGVTISKSYFVDNVGTLSTDAGLIIITDGSINLSDVNASGNDAYGARLYNTTGAYGVTLKNVKFNLNASGVAIHTHGAITATTIEASGNENGLGADLDNVGTTPANVTITNGTFFNNDNTGLRVNSKGNITLSNTSSWSNDIVAGAMGADLNSTAGTGFIKITNLPSVGSDDQQGFDQNSSWGLKILTNGAVTLTNVNAIDNGNSGLDIPLEANKGVTLTNCRFDDNWSGATILTTGTVVVNGGHTNNNDYIGLYIENSYSPDATPKPVSITNFTASGISSYGIVVYSKGMITLSGVSVNGTLGPSGSGIYLDNHWLSAGISLSRVSVYSAFAGVSLYTNGPLTYKSGSVKYNASDGIQLNDGVGYTAKTVILSDLAILDNDGYGMEVISAGPITLTNVSSNGNKAGSGMYLDNTACGTATPCTVSILKTGNNINAFSANVGGYGLRINTFGAVVVNNIAANFNSLYGMQITNNSADPLKPANVTITSGAFSENQNGYGLTIVSRGIISVNGIEATHNYNGYTGAYLDNTSDTSGAKGINITKSKFLDNTFFGLDVWSRGVVILNTVEASENDAGGVYIFNQYGFGKPVTVLASYGANKFNHNINSGISIRSNGSVALTSVTANSSISADGISIDNSNGTGTVTLTNVTANFNNFNGFFLDTKGNVTIRGITAMFNYGLGGSFSGLYIDTNNVPTVKVSITTGVITSNGDYGIHLNMYTPATGPYLYTLSNVFYFGNNSDNANGEINLYIH